MKKKKKFIYYKGHLMLDEGHTFLCQGSRRCLGCSQNIVFEAKASLVAKKPSKHKPINLL